MRGLFLGFIFSLLAAVAFSLLFSLLICLGVDPEVRSFSDVASPLLGIFTGAAIMARSDSWKTGGGIGLLFVGAWFGFWLYVMGRWSPSFWIEQGILRLTVSHWFWWVLAVIAGATGGFCGRDKWRSLIAAVSTALVLVIALIRVEMNSREASVATILNPLEGLQIERTLPQADQTTVDLLTFDFTKQNHFEVSRYDCDSDDAVPYNDSNDTYMGQNLARVATGSAQADKESGQQMLCVINGGFFGASGCSVAHHEEPLEYEGQVLYDVDLLRPAAQAWLFAVNSLDSVQAGRPRFSMLPSTARDNLKSYHMVLGGVRPLRMDGKSIPLQPGAGATSLKCSRTSVGWSSDGNKFYVLVEYDPDSEGASQFQRKMHWPHAGGWDVRDVQKFWENKGVPFALLFDGGESTQLAYRLEDGSFRYLYSGYQYSYTLGYFRQRPLLFTLPILPPSEAHRGVLNYLCILGPVTR